jgi:phenylalanyl-tRNA synthetase alpha chain
MNGQLNGIRAQFDAELRGCGTAEALEELRIKYLGRKRGLVTEAFKLIGTVPPAERGEYGKAANELKQHVSDALEAAAARLKRGEREETPGFDLTLPPPLPRIGRRHPVSEMMRRIESIFMELGYLIEDGPQIETDFNNFQALNMPPHHPARDEHDTFYLEGGMLLRTHTSPVQIRTMLRQKPPIKIICPGRVYRRDYDITHTPMFFQVEGLVVDKGITFGDLKGTLEHFTRRLYGPETRVRFRPSFFPFTEPSAEVDISCPYCGGEGCRVCKKSGWVEIMGSGMVDPAVFRNVGIDPEVYSGFAFGMGVDRQVLLLYGVDDQRLIYENDMRMLEQIGGWR